MQFREKKRPESSLDITPIVDTVFNLLIFFALSLNFIVSPGITVSLPQAVSEEIIREREELIITMNAENGIFVGGRQHTPEELFLFFAHAARKNKESLVIIQADQKSAHGSVVKVMDMAKRAGLKRLAIATAMIREKNQ